jgi:hypothetical protein
LKELHTMAKQFSDDTDGVPISVLDCGTSATVVAEDVPNAVLMANLRRRRLEAEAEAEALSN